MFYMLFIENLLCLAISICVVICTYIKNPKILNIWFLTCTTLVFILIIMVAITLTLYAWGKI